MIRIICVGKEKKKYFQEAIEDYQKRITKYSKIELIELMDEPLEDPIVAMRKEKERILKVLTDKDYIVTLEIGGEMCDSISFSQFIEQSFNQSRQLTFIIGGSFGLDSEIKRLSQKHLSFSKLTFPHQLFRILLLEQIYRSFKIIHHEKYHK